MDFSHFFDSFMPFIESVPVFRAVLGFLLVFFLPGFAWTLVFFKDLHVLERVALSFGLSIALVTLVIIGLNLVFDLKINGANALLTIIVITLIPAGIYLFRRLRNRRAGTAGGD
ncbi:MAG: hypothetical protein A2Z29_05335 [Chloroflexi bacterium RBG_16_56_11]|nr:MAG: hypothetical protein A2Z29_05335 [Chloroflexi bacterium RBG_16_56_11]